MAKKCYVGVVGVARKAKKGYLGIDGLARKIKKAYIGIGGVARPCFGGGKLAYWGSATLSDNRRGAYGAVTAKHALFAGGDDGTTPYFTLVDVFDDSLTQTTTSLGEAKKDHGAESIGGYAIFAGGQYKFGSSYKTSKVYAFDDSLTRTTLTSLSTSTTIGNRNAHVGNYAIFHTGSTNNVYDSSLTRTTIEGFTVSTVGIGVSHKNHALFSSGTEVNVYDASLTHTVTATSRSYTYHAGASNGNHALIGGPTYVEVFDASLTRTDAANLDGLYQYLNAVSLDEHIIFAGGYYSGEDDWGESKAVNAYDASLTKTVQNDLSAGRGEMGVAAIGNFALFCGGRNGSGYDRNTVDIFTVV